MNEWIDWAVRQPGPPEKVYPEQNARIGIVCHFSISLNGTLYQHYPTSASCWASGNKTANTRFIAVESEGIAGTPLNEAQIATWVRLVNELGFSKRGTDIFEHHEVATAWVPNGGGTACPSRRYDPAYLELESEMADPRIDAILAALTGFKGDEAMKVLDKWNINGNSLLAGYTIEQQKLEEHLSNHVTGTLADHTHSIGGAISGS